MVMLGINGLTETGFLLLKGVRLHTSDPLLSHSGESLFKSIGVIMMLLNTMNSYTMKAKAQGTLWKQI